MQPSDSQVEASPQATDSLDAALEKAGIEVAKQPSPPQEDESLVSIMAQGREHLLQRMREHAAEIEAKKSAYKPPPMTDRQRAMLAEEQAAGQRAAQRHAEQLAARPPTPKEPWDGSNTPVHRPGNVVPDPTVAAPSGFVAGSGQFDLEGKHKVIVPQ